MKKASEPNEVSCIVGSYQLTVRNSSNRLYFRAYSEILGRLFEQELIDETLPANLKEQYVKCSVIYGLIGEAIVGKQVVLTDSGELRFRFTVVLGKEEIKKEIVVMLKELWMH
jgi:hypothetical protein